MCTRPMSTFLQKGHPSNSYSSSGCSGLRKAATEDDSESFWSLKRATEYLMSRNIQIRHTTCKREFGLDRGQPTTGICLPVNQCIFFKINLKS